MKYDSEEYTIYYNDCDNSYLSELIDYFEKEMIRILSFFDIKELKKKLVITLYDSIDKYTEYRKGNIFETSVANIDVDSDNYYLNILSYKEFIKRKGHENDLIEYMYKTLIHEFVHICNEDIGTYKNSLIWIKEGIAIVLSNQYSGLNYKINNCTIDDLLTNRRTWNINYYSLMDYALNKYGENYVKNMIFNPSFAIYETSKLYNELLDLLN